MSKATNAGRSFGSSRREVLIGAAGICLAGSQGIVGGLTGGSRAMAAVRLADGQTGADEPRILSVRMRTAADLAAMRDYYRDGLGLEITRETATEVEIRAGGSRITFVKSEAAGDGPFYHFAFNIPENKVKAAHDWQADRGPIIPTPIHMIDRNFPKGVRHFRNWNAHSVFFWDPAGNIVEYIGRHTLDNAAAGPFTPDDILYASEIALIADDATAMAATIREQFGLPQYLQGSDAFRAIGDEHGLLLVFKRGRASGAAIKNPKRYDVFPVDVKIRSEKSLEVADYPYAINAS